MFWWGVLAGAVGVLALQGLGVVFAVWMEVKDRQRQKEWEEDHHIGDELARQAEQN